MPPTTLPITIGNQYQGFQGSFLTSAITPATIDYSVRKCVSANKGSLTSAEKTNACNWLGTGKMVTLTQAQYDAITTKDADTYYFIIEE